MWHTMTKCSPTDGVSPSALFREDALGTTEAPRLHERHFEQSNLRSDFTPALSAGCDLFGATVQISPIGLVKRHCMERYGIVTESIYAPTRSSIEIPRTYDEAMWPSLNETNSMWPSVGNKQGWSAQVVRPEYIYEAHKGEQARQIAELNVERRRTMEAEITGHAVDFIKRNAGAAKPFYAYVSFSLFH